MDLVHLLTSLSLIVSGFLVKRYPNLIAGYNTMSPERKKQVDIEGLSSWLRNGLITIGLVVILGHYIFPFVGISDQANLVMTLIIVGGVGVIILVAQRYTRK